MKVPSKYGPKESPLAPYRRGQLWECSSTDCPMGIDSSPHRFFGHLNGVVQKVVHLKITPHCPFKMAVSW